MLKIKLSSDKELVADIRAQLKENGGYCPCSIIKDESTICPCFEFRNTNKKGPCHCGLYIKVEENN